MIRRTFESVFLNSVANHPEVLPWLGAKGEVDLTDAILNTSNFTLVTDGGGFIFMQHEPCIYEAHSQFLPGSRASVRAMREALEYMFTRTDCEQILTQVPDNNPAAAALGKLARFRLMFRREDTPRGPTAYMGLTIQEWALGCFSLESEGQYFHDRVEAAKKANGSQLPVHPHDPAHERAVGAAIKMIRVGNTAKAVEFYNRWARFAGYVPIRLISEQPPIVDVSDAVAEWRDGDMEILLCR